MTTIAKLYEMQKVLDANIIEKKGLEGQDLLPNTILALQVELGECANEWRGFKHWSSNQSPRYERKCHACDGAGGFILSSNPEDIDRAEECGYCEGTGVEAKPLLEEHVDCLHFFLSIARQLEFTADDLDQVPYCQDDIVEAFTGVITSVGLITIDRDGFYEAWGTFLALGEMLGFTWEQVAEAYIAKNEVNHQRQATGY